MCPGPSCLFSASVKHGIVVHTLTFENEDLDTYRQSAELISPECLEIAMFSFLDIFSLMERMRELICESHSARRFSNIERRERKLFGLACFVIVHLQYLRIGEY